MKMVRLSAPRLLLVATVSNVENAATRVFDCAATFYYTAFLLTASQSQVFGVYTE
jgi:hypothetical protein